MKYEMKAIGGRTIGSVVLAEGIDESALRRAVGPRVRLTRIDTSKACQSDQKPQDQGQKKPNVKAI